MTRESYIIPGPQKMDHARLRRDVLRALGDGKPATAATIASRLNTAEHTAWSALYALARDHIVHRRPTVTTSPGAAPEESLWWLR